MMTPLQSAAPWGQPLQNSPGPRPEESKTGGFSASFLPCTLFYISQAHITHEKRDGSFRLFFLPVFSLPAESRKMAGIVKYEKRCYSIFTTTSAASFLGRAAGDSPGYPSGDTTTGTQSGGRSKSLETAGASKAPS